jgi:hypothetical protein
VDICSGRRECLQRNAKERQSPLTSFDFLISQIATIAFSLDPTPSMFSPHRSTTDLAVAKLDKPITVSCGHRPIFWDLSPPPRPSHLFILGGDQDGDLEDYRPDIEYVQRMTRVSIGGWQYAADLFFSGKSLDYTQRKAVIWRSAKETIRGSSGGMLVRKGDLIGQARWQYHCVGFQSHEIPHQISLQRTPTLYWKIALPPPERLTKRFWASAPGSTCCQMDYRVQTDLNISAYVPRRLFLTS